MSRSKGNRREREAASIYQQAGFQVERATAGGSHSEDFFDLFDLMAFDGAPLDLVQVKANRAAGVQDWCIKAQEFADVPGLTCHMLVAHDYEGWRVIVPQRGEPAVVYDERERDCAMGEGVVDWLRR